VEKTAAQVRAKWKFWISCPLCEGEGFVGEEDCPECEGWGRLPAEEEEPLEEDPGRTPEEEEVLALWVAAYRRARQAGLSPEEAERAADLEAGYEALPF
jgi:RecJ-like exonuclease